MDKDQKYNLFKMKNVHRSHPASENKQNMWVGERIEGQMNELWVQLLTKG
jgi:hypothetical protein